MTHHTREFPFQAQLTRANSHGENSNPNLTPNVADLLTKVNPLPSPDWPRRAEMIAERTRPREPRKEPRNRPKSRAFCLVMLFRAVPLVVQVPFGASGDDAHTNARALTHGTRLTEHSVRLSLVGEPHARVSRASSAHANARDRPPSSGRFSQSIDRERRQDSVRHGIPARDGDRGDGGDGGGASWHPQTYKKRRARTRRVPPLGQSPRRDSPGRRRRDSAWADEDESLGTRGGRRRRRRPTRVFRRGDRSVLSPRYVHNARWP